MKLKVLATITMLSVVTSVSFASPQKPPTTASQIAKEHADLVKELQGKATDSKTGVLNHTKYLTSVEQLASLEAGAAEKMAKVKFENRFSANKSEVSLAEVALLFPFLKKSGNKAVREGFDVISDFVKNAVDTGDANMSNDDINALKTALLMIRDLDTMTEKQAESRIAVMKKANEIYNQNSNSGMTMAKAYGEAITVLHGAAKKKEEANCSRG